MEYIVQNQMQLSNKYLIKQDISKVTLKVFLNTKIQKLITCSEGASPEELRQDIAAKLELHWKSLGGSCSSLHRDNCKKEMP